ncbi:MAG: hypothetical protein ABSA86_07075 [Oryzomonas sp.]|jgi:hypothetical protein
MQCPNCQFDHEDQTTECLRCGIVFAKFFRYQEAARHITAPTLVEEGQPQSLQGAKEELRYRLLALPLALLAAGLLVNTAGGFVRIFLSMWVHEAGHAVTAWLCGFGAFPGPWFTPVSSSRMLPVAIVVATVLCFCIYQSWRTGRSALVVGGVAALTAQLVCTTLPIIEANALVIFGGDAGCLVLGSLLMATFYARRDSSLYRGALRWGFLVIGAAAFMDASRTWWGARSDPGFIPFGENEGVGLSDPSRLTEDYGWAMQTMVDRYVWLGVACLVFLAVLYVVGIVQARSAVRMKARSSRIPVKSPSLREK